MKYAWIATHRKEFEVEAMCSVLEVSCSGYYAWRKRPPSARRKRQEELLNEIKQIHVESRRIYGSPRVFKELNARGVKGCENTVAKLMQKAQIRSKIVKKFVPKTTDSRHDFPVADNLLNREFKAQEPNRKWVADITYIETREGWLYLAAVLDLYSRPLLSG